MYQGKYLSTTPAAPAKPPKKKKSRLGTVVFYSIYFVAVAVAVCAIFQIMNPLRAWLETYQASQPENKSQEIFAQLFENPDWEALYDMAGVEDTAYESGSAYRAYMEEKVGDDELTFLKTSAGLSGDRKYVVRHGNEKIATFTMEGTENPDTRITTWELGKVEVMFQREQSVVVEAAANQTVYINDVALSNNAVIQSTDTLAEEYLPTGLHGYRTKKLQLDGLLVEPKVTVKNADGSNAQVTQKDGVYTAVFDVPKMTEDEKKIAVEAAKAQALYAIRAVDRSKLRQHFDRDSQIYSDICDTEIFMQDYLGYEIDDSSIAVNDFYRYSDDLFSAHVSLKLKVTRIDYTVKTYNAASTFFFARQDDDRFLVNNMTNVRIQEQRVKVRLRFIAAEPVSMTVPADSRELTPPEVKVPAGKKFQGWAKKEIDSEGRNVMTILFVPNETGKVDLPGTQLLEPVVLYPVFE